jgi:hypothetical protein
MKTLHGFSSHGFPNCYLMGLSQNGFSVNLTSMLDDQAQHIGYIIKQVIERGARYAHPTEEAEAAWVRRYAGWPSMPPRSSTRARRVLQQRGTPRAAGRRTER